MLFSFDVSAQPVAAHPDHAERTIERWTTNSVDSEYCAAVSADPAGAKLLHAIAGNSPFLAQCLQRDAAFACRLLREGPDKTFANILANLRGV